MTSHTGRLYVLACSLATFFLVWALVAAHPWGTARSDARVAALSAREARLRHEAVLVRQLVAQRWKAYRVQLGLRRSQIASARFRERLVGGRGGARRQSAAADDHEDVMIESRFFHAMGTEIELLVDAPRAPDWAFDLAEAEFHRLEAVLSRFRPESELSRLNRERRLDAGPDLCRVLELALAARRETGGRFDPTVHDALVAAGFDHSFELVPADSEEPAARAVVAAARGVHLDGSRIELDPGVHVDLGGIGKGYAAERAAELLALAGPCLVNAGGDIADPRRGAGRSGRDRRWAPDAAS